MLGDVVVVAFALFIAVPSAYLAFLAVVTVLPRPAPSFELRSAGLLRFAVLVPAHDEEPVVGATVASLLRLDYPRERFSVHVVADNCADATAEVARRNGACVHERNEPRIRGKGAALNWLAESLAAEIADADAYVVVDADTVVSANLLAALERHLARGADAVQTLYIVAASSDQPLVRLRELALRLVCHLRPLAYTILGASTPLFGNGMCFSAALWRRYRWSESSVVEDGELFLRLVHDGRRVALADEASVSAAMPTTFRDARSQALRWERGRFDHFLLCAGLACRGAVRRDINDLFAGLSVLIPPFTVLLAGDILALASAALLRWIPLAVLAAAALLCLIFYVFRGAALGALTARTMFRIVLWAPQYTAWKVWMVFLAAVGVGRGDWTRTARVRLGR